MLFNYQSDESARKLKFRLASTLVLGLIQKQMPTIIHLARLGIRILRRRGENEIPVSTSPGCASYVPRGQDDVFEVFAIGAEDHDATGAVDSHPEVSLLAV